MDRIFALLYIRYPAEYQIQYSTWPNYRPTGHMSYPIQYPDFGVFSGYRISGKISSIRHDFQYPARLPISDKISSIRQDFQYPARFPVSGKIFSIQQDFQYPARFPVSGKISSILVDIKFTIRSLPFIWPTGYPARDIWSKVIEFLDLEVFLW